MMSKYSDDRFEDYSFSPASSPQGRRYVLQNFNMRKQRERSLRQSYRKFNPYHEYFDIRKAPASESSRTSNNSNKSNHIGVSNKVMPTNVPAGMSPRKLPRDPPLYVTPRRDLNAKNVKAAPLENKETVANKKVGTSKSQPVKETKIQSVTKTEKGMTPRDEYMVTKLYEHEIIHLKPSDIRYTHDEITAHFTDGRSLLSTFKSLLYGKIEIRQGGDGVPPIEVMQVEEKGQKLWFVVNGNRRLYIFRRLEKCGALKSMQVVARRYDSIEMDKHFSTRNLGQTISITNDATIREKMGKEIKSWRQWISTQHKDKTKIKAKNTKAPKTKSKAPTSPKKGNFFSFSCLDSQSCRAGSSL